MNNSTLAGNIASNKGGGIYNGASAVFHVRHTLLAGNAAAASPNCAGLGTIDNRGFNLQFGPGAGCGRIAAGDPKLGPLAYDGDTLPGMALLAGSEAIEEGDPASCADMSGAAALAAQVADDEGLPGTMDCIDHSSTTTKFLRLLEGRGALHFHRVLEPARRGWVFQHYSAQIEEIQPELMHAETEHIHRFAVDSWYVDNGHPAPVIPLETWHEGSDPDV